MPEGDDPLPKGWLRQEFQRARVRSAQVPKHARPVVVRGSFMDGGQGKPPVNDGPDTSAPYGSRGKVYRGWFGRTAKRRCPHSRLTGIYGDRINQVGGWRLLCVDCGRYLDGPVALARRRRAEDDG